MSQVYRAVLAAVLAVLVIPPLVLPIFAPDADAPSDISRILPDAKRYLASQLELGPAFVRFVGAETRDRDQLVILRFELWAFPTLTPEGAYLVSRCTPIDELDPHTFGGGRGVNDFATDPELEYLRSDAQPACLADGAGVDRSGADARGAPVSCAGVSVQGSSAPAHRAV